MPDILADNLVRVAALAESDRPESAALLVRFSMPAELAGRLVQVYVNGELAAATERAEQRELLVPAPPSPDWPAADVRLLAVQPRDADEDFSALLGEQPRGGRVRLRWPRTNNVPPGSTLNVFGNGEAGAIDFAWPLNERPIPWWPDGVGMWGFGLAPFAEADFGGDCAAMSGCPGFAVGGFGIGQFGFDAEWASWLSPPLAGGQHRLAVVVLDELGNASPPSPEVEATIVPLPPRVAEPAVAGDADRLVISWT